MLGSKAAALLGFVVVVVSTTVFAMLPPMPVVVWTGREQVLKSGSAEVSKSLTTSMVADLVKFAAGSSTDLPEELSAFAAAEHHKPELVLVFVHPELFSSQLTSMGGGFSATNDAGSFRHLKTVVERSPASLVLPYVYQPDQQTLTEALSGVEHLHSVDAEDAPAFLHGKQWMYKDGKTDVVVVKFSETKLSGNALAEKLKSDDELMGQILNKVHAPTDGDYLAVFGANTPSQSPVRRLVKLAQQQDVQLSAKSRARSKAEADVEYYIYTSPAIFGTLLISLFLLCITCCGVSCLMDLKTPDTFEGEGGFLAGPL